MFLMPTAIWIVQLNTAQTEFKARYKLETFGQINNTFQDFMLESIYQDSGPFAQGT